MHQILDEDVQGDQQCFEVQECHRPSRFGRSQKRCGERGVADARRFGRLAVGWRAR